MQRFLFVVPPLMGHINPTLAVGDCLIEQGHEVAWVGYASKIESALGATRRLIELDESQIGTASDEWIEKAKKSFGLSSFKFLWEEFFIPLSRYMYPGVEQAIQDFRPDVVISDQQAFAGGLAARKNKKPWATLVTTSASISDSMNQFPKVKDWFIERLGLLQDDYQLPRLERPDLSDRAVIVFSVRELMEPDEVFPNHYRFVGPSLRPSVDAVDFPWERLDSTLKKIYVTLGTINAERSVDFYQKVKAAFGDGAVQLILSAPHEMVGEVPKNFLVCPYVPQLELLKKMDLVICHGGHNTVCESLWNGVPIVVAPIKDDQPVVAGQVVRSGAGLRVHFNRVKAENLREVAMKVMNEPSYRHSAEKISQKFKASGGARRAADLLLRVRLKERLLPKRRDYLS